MGLFINKAVKSALDKKKMVTSYLVAALCLVLVVLNVAAFMLFPRIISPLAVVLSNAITVMLMLFAIRPINNLIQNEFDKKAHELLERESEERQLREKLSALENRNHELESRIDTWSQTANSPSDVQLTFKVETMTYDKSGYIVKEEPLERFINDPAYKLPDKKDMIDRIATWVNERLHPGRKKVLYIGKYYVKASIGIDMTKIKYAIGDGGALTLFGVRFTKLNDLAIKRDEGDVNHCWLINEDEGNVAINPSELYTDFVQIYAANRAKETETALEGEVETLCNSCTEAFRNNLAARFPGIAFCDAIEGTDTTWYSLKDNFGNERIRSVATNILLMADALGGYVSGSGKLLD
ncbi:MAG: hypothetical protein J6X89_02435 [Bacteroidales bacterium]|nr:hypothetical protein [Bacteroidales bacterium]